MSEATTFTLDTNCVIAMHRRHENERERKIASAIDVLLDKHREGKANVALVASTASEKQPAGRPKFETIGEFRAWINSLGFDKVELLKPIGRVGFSFSDHAYMANYDGEMMQLENKIREILFPGVAPKCRIFVDGVEQKNAFSSEKREANGMRDVEIFWAHAWHKRAVFVSADGNFHKYKTELEQLANCKVVYPEEASDLA